MTSTIKVNNIQNQCGANIINESSNTITIGASGDTVSLASGASQTGFGRTGTVDWDTTPKTANFTAVSGDGFFVNTTSGAITATLPAGSAGAIVAFADYANTFDTNKLTITPNGTDKIAGTNDSAVITTEGASATFVYVDSTQGWKQINDATLNVIGQSFITATGGTITTCGNFKIHTFTGPGTFTVCSVGNTPAINTVDYLVVAGGGGAGATPGNSGGGGGAGGLRFFASPTCNPQSGPGSPRNAPAGIVVTATSFPITVGGGGAPPGTGSDFSGPDGSNSVFSTITSAGGGGGGSGNPGAEPNINGKNGGSGGGGGGGNTVSTGGTGNTPPVSPAQGTNGGGNACGPATPDHQSNGGGGAVAAGQPTQGSVGGNGGAGAGLTGFGSSNGVANPSPDGFRYFAGGGAAGRNTPTMSSNASGGLGGGGAPPGTASAAGSAGTTNTGGGGGGGTSPAGAGGAGGSGIVVIRYKFQ